MFWNPASVANKWEGIWNKGNLDKTKARGDQHSKGGWGEMDQDKEADAGWSCKSLLKPVPEAEREDTLAGYENQPWTEKIESRTFLHLWFDVFSVLPWLVNLCLPPASIINSNCYMSFSLKNGSVKGTEHVFVPLTASWWLRSTFFSVIGY